MGMRKRRYYVSATWEKWPHYGFYKTIVEAQTGDQAKTFCLMEMQNVMADCETQDALEEIAREFHVVDCFDVDGFISKHGGRRWIRA